MHRIATLVLFFVAAVCPAAESATLPSEKDFHLYLLVGQSNMAGRGKATSADKKPFDRVLMYTKEGEWKPATAPLHFDKPKIVGVGIGRSFAKKVLGERKDITIGLIPCAVGGSPIDSWTEGAFYKPTKSHPWDDALRRAKAALKTGRLKGILWHQGESDSKPGLAQAYAKKLHALVARFRKELKAKNVPFIAGQMGQFEERPWSDDKKLVDQAHQDLSKHVSNSAFVSSDGLKHKGDKVHFDADSYRELGRRYADAYLQLVK